jgi:hypothetical protein
MKGKGGINQIVSKLKWNFIRTYRQLDLNFYRFYTANHDYLAIPFIIVSVIALFGGSIPGFHPSIRLSTYIAFMVIVVAARLQAYGYTIIPISIFLFIIHLLAHFGIMGSGMYFISTGVFCSICVFIPGKERNPSDFMIHDAGLKDHIRMPELRKLAAQGALSRDQILQHFGKDLKEEEIDNLILALTDDKDIWTKIAILKNQNRLLKPHLLNALGNPQFYDENAGFVPAAVNVLDLLVESGDFPSEECEDAILKVYRKNPQLKKRIAPFVLALGNDMAVNMMDELLDFHFWDRETAKRENQMNVEYLTYRVLRSVQTTHFTKSFQAKLINWLERILKDGSGFIFEGREYFDTYFKQEYIELAQLYAFDSNGNPNNDCLEVLSKNKIPFANPWIPIQLGTLTSDALNENGLNAYSKRKGLENLLPLYAITNPHEAKEFAQQLIEIDEKQIKRIAYQVLVTIEGLDNWRDTFDYTEVMNNASSELKIERAYALSYIADADTCNGGLFQYLYNPYSDIHKENIEAFRMMSMEEKTSIFEKLDELFKPNGVPKNRETRQMIMSNKYSGIESSISKLEGQYFQSSEDHQVYTCLMVLRNKEYFLKRIQLHKELQYKKTQQTTSEASGDSK